MVSEHVTFTAGLFDLGETSSVSPDVFTVFITSAKEIMFLLPFVPLFVFGRKATVKSRIEPC